MRECARADEVVSVERRDSIKRVDDLTRALDAKTAELAALEDRVSVPAIRSLIGRCVR